MDIMLFALNASKDWGTHLVSHVKNIRLASHEERDFEDGEHKVRSLENVRNQHVFLVQSLFSDREQSVNDKLCRLLFFIGALKDAAAHEVTVIIPYFAYARKDRKTKSRDPVTIKYVAQLLEAVGTDRVVTIDVHNVAAFQNAFRIPTEHLESRVLFAPYFANIVQDEEITIVSPDAGGAKRAEYFRETLSELLQKEVRKAFLDKQRSAGEVSGGQVIVGEVKDRTAIIVDDMISSGSTIRLAVEALHREGAKRIMACATHGVFLDKANQTLADSRLEKIIITNTVSSHRLNKQLLHGKVIVLDATQLFAQAVKIMYEGGSIVELLQKYQENKMS
ncbi:ribose-phosphate diphosphokinase [Legionella nagasakiensis]|uniref:ribose-phosphate diphosphokinase n=1 Tax=Legionella nagasakiensis TaxID=535290 RepID=UPI0010556E39|nr:ribose-phosphate pyrophosphokinase [Legionella nagasakiensis]